MRKGVILQCLDTVSERDIGVISKYIPPSIGQSGRRDSLRRRQWRGILQCVDRASTLNIGVSAKHATTPPASLEGWIV